MACPFILHPPALPHSSRGLVWATSLHIQVPVTPLVCATPRPPSPNSVYPVEDEPGEEDCRLEKQVWDLLGKEFLGAVCLWYVLRRWGTSTWPYGLSTLWGGVRLDKSQRGALLQCWPRARSLLLDLRANSLPKSQQLHQVPWVTWSLLEANLSPLSPPHTGSAETSRAILEGKNFIEI